MAGTWNGLAHQPSFNTSTMILLSDGRVMVQEEATQHWHALSPDSHGSYTDGTWSPLADMSFWRRYYASGMLKDGGTSSYQSSLFNGVSQCGRGRISIISHSG